MQNLPIDELVAQIMDALRGDRRLVLQAPPGSGKSTRIPPALLNAIPPYKQVWVAEPRRIAARLLANRVSSEMGQRVGSLVGYRVRFEDACGPDTRLLYVTSGVLLRRILRDPELSGVGCVVIDEFHERHLDTDLVLAMAIRAQQTVRADLLIVVMSATLQGERIQKMMGGCPYFSSEDKIHPMTVEYDAQADDRPLEKRVLSAVRSQLRVCCGGDILVFLPGASEIRRASETVLPIAKEIDIEVRSLHGDMPLGMQATALQLSNRRKVVLATNVAESSITVPGIVGVVDSGLARIAACSAWSGLPILEVQKISRASAAQRAGRAGRLSPGRVTRLYTRADFESRAPFETPEMLRLDLCEAILLLRGAGVRDLQELVLLDYPSQTQLQAGEQLLANLGAMSAEAGLSDLGKQMLQLPVHPRLAGLVLESNRRGIADLGCLTAALLSERDLRIDSRARMSSDSPAIKAQTGDSDVEELIEAYEFAVSRNFHPETCARERIDSRAARTVADVTRQLQQCIPDIQTQVIELVSRDEELAKSLLLAFPDRVAWRRESGQRDLVMTNGNVAQLSDQSVVHDARYMLALIADERPTRGRRGATIIRVACRIDPNWLLELRSEQVITEEHLVWVDPPGRVETVSTIRYGAVVLDESRAMARAGPAVAQLLAATAEVQGVLNGDALASLKERINILIEFGLLPKELLLIDTVVRTKLEQICWNRVDLADVSCSSVATQLVQDMQLSSAKALRELAPEDYRLIGGRSVRVHYDPGRSPWIASRLQDFSE